MKNITHCVGAKSSKEDILRALTTIDGLAGWWTSTTSGSSELNGILEFRFGESGPDFKVIKIENSIIEWECIVGPEEWIKTKIRFEIIESDDENTIFFSHRGWKEESPFHHHCSMKWAIFMLSLKQYLEEGEGRPFPNDIQIDHRSHG